MPGWLWIPIGFGIFNLLLLALLFVGHVMMTSKMYTMVCQINEKVHQDESQETPETEEE